MSIPVNHHYVSECLIKNFYNDADGKIYLYDKEQLRHFFNSGTKRIFSQPHDNTTIVDGKLSFHIEAELNTYFEKDFPHHYQQLCKFTQGEYHLNIESDVAYIAKMGMIGDMRNTQTKEGMHKSIFEAFEQIFSNATPELSESWEGAKKDRIGFKMRTNSSYLEIAEDMFKRMGNWNFCLIEAPANHYFLLSDCTGYIIKGRINDYFNPDALDTVEIGIPLNSRLFLVINAEKFRKYENRFIKADYPTCERINDNLFRFSKKWLACQNEVFLKTFVANQVMPTKSF
jgi:hypothetical protein